MEHCGPASVATWLLTRSGGMARATGRLNLKEHLDTDASEKRQPCNSFDDVGFQPGDLINRAILVHNRDFRHLEVLVIR